MSYRLLACDIDNTLVRFPNSPSPRVQGAVRAAIDAGITVILVTGRAFRRARPIAETLQLDTPIICNHGGNIRQVSTGETIHRHVLPYSIAHSIVAWAQTQDVHTLLFDGDEAGHRCTKEVLERLSHHLFVQSVLLEPEQQPDSLDADALTALLG